MDIKNISENTIGPFVLERDHKDLVQELVESRIGLKFKTRKDFEHVTIEKPQFNGVQIKSLVATCQKEVKLIIMNFPQYVEPDYFYGVIDFFVQIFGQPDQKKTFANEVDFVQEMFRTSEHQIIRDTWKTIQDQPNYLHWNFEQSKLIINFALLENEEEPVKTFSLSARLSSIDYPKK